MFWFPVIPRDDFFQKNGAVAAKALSCRLPLIVRCSLTPEIIAILLLTLLFVGSCIAWLTNLLGLPGNWMIVLAAAIYAYLWYSWGWETGMTAIEWPGVVILFVLALLGEGLELVAGAAGAKGVGGSKRGAILSFLVSIIGGIVGMFIGTAILPVVGSVLGALTFACVGALIGAVLGEQWKGRQIEESLEIG
ncbi:MAG TPA: hypothetical protein DCY79_03760, partial [Planctomycetaceae bacterium]|nr:hypothetical protein [Planctomycetaceae bacterium]